MRVLAVLEFPIRLYMYGAKGLLALELRPDPEFSTPRTRSIFSRECKRRLSRRGLSVRYEPEVFWGWIQDEMGFDFPLLYKYFLAGFAPHFPDDVEIKIKRWEFIFKNWTEAEKSRVNEILELFKSGTLSELIRLLSYYFKDIHFESFWPRSYRGDFEKMLDKLADRLKGAGYSVIGLSRLSRVIGRLRGLYRDLDLNKHDRWFYI
jgi:hypothetical protein